MYNPTLFNNLAQAAAAALPAADETSPGPEFGAATSTETGLARDPALDPGWLYPATQSEFAAYIDRINDFINIVSLVCFIGIIAFMVYFAVRFRRRDPHQKAESQRSHNIVLELGWTLPPLVIVFIMFWLGFDGYMTLATPPDNAYQVEAMAQKWAWSFRHPNARVDAAERADLGEAGSVQIPAILHVPAGEPVVIRIEARDVLHSLSIPAFRVKKDAVPGRYTSLWFEAKEPTRFHYDQHADKASTPEQRAQKLKLAADNGFILFCTEFCGTDHSNMWARVVVHPKGWRPAEQDLSSLPPAERGQKYFEQSGCAACHQLDPTGPKLVGPTFAQGIFGKEETLTTGEKQSIDEDYLFESIRNPSAKIVAGHAPGMMPPQDQLTDDQIRDIIEYIKTIGQNPARPASQ